MSYLAVFLCKIPVLVQDLFPDLWKWPRTWSRLGWTLQEWTSLMAHMKWVWSSQQIIFCACSIYFTAQSQMMMSEQVIYQWLSRPRHLLWPHWFKCVRRSATCLRVWTQTGQHSSGVFPLWKWLSGFTLCSCSHQRVITLVACLWL